MKLFSFLSFLLLTLISFCKEETYLDFPQPTGAKVIGMGYAFCGVANDINTIYFNPAGLILIKDFEIINMYTHNSFKNTTTNFIATAKKINNHSTIAIGYLEDVTTILAIPGFKEYDYQQQIYVISYATQLTEKIFIGMNYKNYKQSFPLSLGASEDYGLDLGVLIRLREKNFIGINLKNIKEVRLKNLEAGGYDKSPISIRIGIGYKTYYNKLLLAYDLEKIHRQDIIHHIGLEYTIHKNILLRVGLNEEKYKRKLLLGIGFTSDNFSIDYAYDNAELTNTQYISVTYAK